MYLFYRGLIHQDPGLGSTRGFSPRPASSRQVSSRSSRKSRRRFTTRATPNKNASSVCASTFSSPISFRVSSSCPFLVFFLVSSSAWWSTKQKSALAQYSQHLWKVTASNAHCHDMLPYALLRSAATAAPPGSSMLLCLSAPPLWVRTENCVAWNRLLSFLKSPPILDQCLRQGYRPYLSSRSAQRYQQSSLPQTCHVGCDVTFHPQLYPFSKPSSSSFSFRDHRDVGVPPARCSRCRTHFARSEASRYHSHSDLDRCSVFFLTKVRVAWCPFMHDQFVDFLLVFSRLLQQLLLLSALVSRVSCSHFLFFAQRLVPV